MNYFSKDFWEKLYNGRYKTAYSEMYDARVAIVKVRSDRLGEPIIDARVAGSDTITLFRPWELKNYVL